MIIGKRLSGDDASFALLAINVGSVATTVTCDADCFAKLGASAGASFAAHDVWANTTASVTGLNWTVTLGPTTGIAMAVLRKI